MSNNHQFPDEVTVLHLSDIHFSRAQKIQSKIREHILSSIIDHLTEVSNYDSSWSPKAIAISGDITFKGDKSEYELAGEWIESLIKSLGLSNSDVFICPGNHDIRRHKIRERTKSFKTSHQVMSFAHSELIIDDEKIADFANSEFRTYSEFCRKHGFNDLESLEGFDNNFIVGCKIHEKTGLAFNILNSSWLCRGCNPLADPDSDDFGPLDWGNLFISKPITENILRLSKTNAELYSEIIPSFTLIHHPPDWLNRRERYRDRPESYPAYEVVVNNSDFILSGHEHALGKSPDKISNKALLIMAGASFFKETADGKGNFINQDNYNSFNLLKVNRANQTLTKREFYFNLAHSYGSWKELKMADDEQVHSFGNKINDMVNEWPNMKATVDLLKKNQEILLKRIEGNPPYPNFLNPNNVR